jgi:mRNA interferase MazF
MGAREARPARTYVGPPRRGEVYLVAFDPTIGAEIRKTRPAVVVQNDIGNRAASTTIVAAVSSLGEERLYPFEVVVRPPDGGVTKASTVLLNQIRTVDRRRLIRRLGKLGSETMRRVDRALAISAGLVEI